MAGPGAEIAIEEDAADLQFPPEFEKGDTKTLLISEGKKLFGFHFDFSKPHVFPLTTIKIGY